MRAKELSLKRLFVFSVVVMLVVALSMFVAACHRSKGGGGAAPVEPPPGIEPPIPGPTPAGGPVVFQTPAEATSGLPTVQAVRSLADAQFDAAMLLVADSRPPGFAPAMNAGDIGALDPTLKTMVDAMAKLAQSPAVRKASAKAGEFKTASMLATMRTQTVPPTTFAADMCPAGGSVTISGTNNLDDVNSTNLISSYQIVFADCMDDVLFTKLTGTLNVDQTESIDTAALATSLTANLTETTFTDETFATATQEVKLSNAFSDSDQITSGERTATGSIAMTVQGTTTTYAWTDLRDRMTSSVDTAGHTDEEHSITGSLMVSTATGGATTKSLTVAMAVADVWHIVANDPSGTRRRTIEGTVDVSWSPAITGCIPGRLTVSMPDLANTLEYTAVGGYTCPIKGVIRANNSAVTYGPTIHVTLDGGADQAYVDCAALNAAAQTCGY